MIDDRFNALSSKDEKMRLTQEHRERMEKIERIADLGRREQLYNQLKENDRQMQVAKSKARQLEEKSVQESIRQNIAPKHGLHLKPRYGSPLPPRTQETQIRTNIRRSLGTKLDRQQAHLRSSLNKKLDNAINRSRSKQIQKKEVFSKNADDITETEMKPSRETHSKARTTTRGRIRRR